LTTAQSSLENIRRLPGFVGGLAIIIFSGWALHFVGFSLARKIGGNQSLYELLALTLTFTISFVLLVRLQINFWLSKLMGLKHGRSHVIEAGLFWLFGIIWAFVRAAGAEPEEENGAKSDREKHPQQPRDPARESVETIVFVVVLVLLLKLFVTEAFVIPTGSMAETLYGYQKIVKCEACGHEFPVNSHDEVEPGQDGQMRTVVGYCCPNCRFEGRLGANNTTRPMNNTGDRVLVLKPLYHLTSPKRGDVVVFKYPEAPQIKHTAQNYIKRAMGFGRETIGIHRGELFHTTALEYPADLLGDDGTPMYPRPGDTLDLWRPRYMYPNNIDYAKYIELMKELKSPAEAERESAKFKLSQYSVNGRALELFETSRAAGFLDAVPGGFQIVRKPDEQMLADRRIVWDNDKQPEEFVRRKVPPRWHATPESAPHWNADNPALPRAFAHTAGDLHWIRYRHLIGVWSDRPDRLEPRPIDNFLGYNSGRERDTMGNEAPPRSAAESSWVGDLIIECEAELGDGAEIVLELSKGTSRFQATFAGGQVTLSRTGPNAGTLASRSCAVKGSGKYNLRFANVDCRLRVWVDGRNVDFGSDGDYAPAESAQFDEKDINREGWYWPNDVEAPANIGAKGNVTVRHLRLDRDIYYTRGGHGEFLYYVQPGHYMCLGDNSAQSSDSRTWGTVPERLMLGKAVFVFWPGIPENRIGFIK
jgi:signal peptidase I